jgi:hypothetical protein
MRVVKVLLVIVGFRVLYRFICWFFINVTKIKGVK